MKIACFGCYRLIYCNIFSDNSHVKLSPFVKLGGLEVIALSGAGSLTRGSRGIGSETAPICRAAWPHSHPVIEQPPSGPGSGPALPYVKKPNSARYDRPS